MGEKTKARVSMVQCIESSEQSVLHTVGYMKGGSENEGGILSISSGTVHTLSTFKLSSSCLIGDGESLKVV